MYPTTGQDRWIAIACETDEQWRALARCLERDDLAALNVDERLSRAIELDALIGQWTAGESEETLERLLQKLGVPAHRVQNSPELVADPQLQHRGHWWTVRHPTHESMVIEGSRPLLSRTPGTESRSGPMLGEHNDLVLREFLGYGDDRVTELVIAGALG